MANDSTAAVVLELRNAQQILEVVRQLTEAADRLERAGSVDGSKPATHPVSPTAGTAGSSASGAVAVASTSPTQLSPAAAGQPTQPAAAAGQSGVVTPGVAPTGFPTSSPASPATGGQPAAQVTAAPAPGITPPPVLASPPSTLRQLGQALAAVEYGRRIVDAGTSMAGLYGQSIASGRPFSLTSIEPELASLGFATAGLAIGSAFGPPGMLAGLTIGLGVGSIYTSFAKPLAERDTLLEDYRGFANALGLPEPASMPMPLLQAGFEQMRSGQYLSPRIQEQVGGRDTRGVLATLAGLGKAGVVPDSIIDSVIERFPGIYGAKTGGLIDNPTAAADYLSTLTEAAYLPGNVKEFGFQQDVESLPLSSQRDMLLRYARTGKGAALRASHAFRELGLPRKAEEARGLFTQQFEMEQQGGFAQAELLFATDAFEKAGRREGVAGATLQSEALASSLASVASAMRARADFIRPNEPGTAAALDAEASILEESGRDKIKDRLLGMSRNERQAKLAGLQGDADRAFQSALYGGAKASDLPWDKAAEALTTEIRGLKDEMAKFGDRMTPAEKMIYAEQIKQAEFKRDFVLPRQAEEANTEERRAEIAKNLATQRTAVISPLLRGSSEDLTSAEFDLQTGAIQQRIQLLREELEVRKHMTNLEKIQHETEIQGLEVQKASLDVAKERAMTAERLDTGFLQSSERRAGINVSLLSSDGGLSGVAQRVERAALAKQDLARVESEIQEKLKDNKYAWDSADVKELRAMRSQLQEQVAAEQSGIMNAPASAKLRAQESNLQAQAELIKAGFGTSFGDLRANLKAQAQLKQQQLSELEEMKKAKGRAFGWSDEDEADYAQRRNALILDTAKIAHQATYGWDQRLISEAFNTPANGRLAMSQFTRYEASVMAGIQHPSFGGSETQTRGMRTEMQEWARLVRGGSPSEFKDRAVATKELYLPSERSPIAMLDARGIASQAGQQKIELHLHISGEGASKLRVTDTLINGHQTAVTLNENAEARRTQKG